MPAPSTAAALRDYVASLGIGGARPWAVALDRVRPGDKVPHIVVHSLIAWTREPMGDTGDQAAMDDGVTELEQIDVVQRIRDAAWSPEDYAAPDRVVAAVHGCRLPSAPYRVYAVTVDSALRIDGPDSNLTRTAITVRIRRSLRRTA